VRAALRRGTLEHHGEPSDIPYRGPGATGLGRPLKLLGRPLRGDIPIYLAALAPKSVELAAEIADGWLPLFVSPERFGDVFRPHLARARDGFEIVAGAHVVVGDDLDACRDVVKQTLALYVGGMGARGS